MAGNFFMAPGGVLSAASLNDVSSKQNHRDFSPNSGDVYILLKRKKRSG
jgi:hypothetical protein